MHDLLHRPAVGLLFTAGVATPAAGAILAREARLRASRNMAWRQEG